MCISLVRQEVHPELSERLHVYKITLAYVCRCTRRVLPLLEPGQEDNRADGEIAVAGHGQPLGDIREKLGPERREPKWPRPGRVNR